MWSMVLEADIGILGWEEDGVGQMDGPTDIHPIGDGVAAGGRARALDLGALTIKIGRAASFYSCALTRMAAPKKYHSTAKGLMMWANSELEHVGRIASVEDPDLQYSYAMSTLNGMAHLKDALYEFVTERRGEPMTKDIKLIHDKVVRVMKHLVKTYKLNLDTIVQFNTRKVLSSLNYLKATKNTRKIKKN